MQEDIRNSSTAERKGLYSTRQDYPLWHARTHSSDQGVRTDSAVPCSARSFKIAFIGTLSPPWIVMNGIHMEHQDFPSGPDLTASFILQATKHTPSPSQLLQHQRANLSMESQLNMIISIQKEKKSKFVAIHLIFHHYLQKGGIPL